MSPETYFYTYVSDFSKCEHPCVSGCIKYVAYILTEMLLCQIGLQLLLENWRIYWLKLDKPVCYILRDRVIDSELWMLSLLCSNEGPFLDLFLTSRGVEIYRLLSRFFFRSFFFFFLFTQLGWKMRCGCFFRSKHQLSVRPVPNLISRSSFFYFNLANKL